MAGRPKMAVVGSARCIKVSPMEGELTKRFLKVVRSGAGSSVDNAIERLDVLKGSIRKAADGERFKISIRMLPEEWEQVQPFIKALMRCSDDERLRIVETLERVEKEIEEHSDDGYIVVFGNGSKLSAVVTDTLQEASNEFKKVVAELVADAGLQIDCSKAISGGVFSSGDLFAKICKVVKDERLTLK